ncbi:MAG: WYL domain-containing protein [Rhodocyclaceae bacterium]|nr:WYL domain-containing protein [Rhodocyclaceae bacterium]MBX3668422.1 WYL domain-containing protein [Rhodocyclaceae bacterium]
MDRTERFYKIDQLLHERGNASFDFLLEKLEISRATLKRDLAYMRERLHAPIVYARERGGYEFERRGNTTGAQYELPGLWFSAEEIHALLTMQQLLDGLDGGGLLGPHIQPLRARLAALMDSRDHGAEEISRRVKITAIGARPFHLQHFQTVGSALIARKRLEIAYYARSRGEHSTRLVSPQRLVHYRNNWYLDAWCHLRRGLRSFALDAIESAQITDQAARDVSQAALNRVLGAGYGIFSGRAQHWATLRFSAQRARWVATERWHARQKGRSLPDGSYELRLPYSQDHELVMDILKYGADCEVLAPPQLRARIAAELARAAERYAGAS